MIFETNHINLFTGNKQINKALKFASELMSNKLNTGETQNGI